MNFYLGFYKLQSRYFLNSQNEEKKKYGALLKCEFSDKKIGYSDFHFDQKINSSHLCKQEILEKTKLLFNSQQFQNSINFAKEECMNECEEDLSSIENHYLILDILNFSKKDMITYENQNFKFFKIKMGRNLREETKILKKIIDESKADTKFRLDLNSSLSLDDFKSWMSSNKDDFGERNSKKIDFIEDPFPYELNSWREVEKLYKIPLALDLTSGEIDNFLERINPEISILVLKPAIIDVEKIINIYKNKNTKFVFTHFMDHPIGQIQSFKKACFYKKYLKSQILTCGFHSGDYFRNKEFKKYKFNGPIFSKKIKKISSLFKEEICGMNWISMGKL